jgi:hypothetical protein
LANAHRHYETGFNVILNPKLKQILKRPRPPPGGFPQGSLKTRAAIIVQHG